jgi:NADH-quinone oxidoreductase subunit E
MADENPFDDYVKLSQSAAPDPFAGMANLMAHPVAGMAAASAIGFGMASHAFGLWMGAMAGATEVSRRMLAETEAEEKTAPGPRLKLVSVNAAEEVASLARTVEADVEKIARDAAVVSAKAAEALLDDVKKATESAMRAPARKAKPARPGRGAGGGGDRMAGRAIGIWRPNRP